ncbi:MAG: lipoyl(octanoyl) transferase LipB [Mariprofundaceae bacterium]|nr:lipoyl(octanoyl) transferase LipB [Mariprofundaceae bacterium]
MDLARLLRQHQEMLHADHPSSPNPEFSWQGRIDHSAMWQHMQEQAELLIESKQSDAEIIWACEHEPVYTTGRRGIDNRRSVNLPAPLVVTDRGGETTFHGPGQVMLYPVLSLRERGLGVRDYVCLLEQSCIDLLQNYGISAGRREGLPGVWVGSAKIGAIGLRISRGVVWHGMALNVCVDANWFAAINACGAGLGVTGMHAFVDPPPLADVANGWYALLCARLAAVA